MIYGPFTTWALCLLSMTIGVGLMIPHAGSSLSLWVMMELLTICLIGGLSFQSCLVVESLLKYFLVQTFGGLLYLYSAVSALPWEIGVMMSALLKLGVFPLSLWVVPLVSCQSFMGLWAMSTIMKVPGAMILSQVWGEAAAICSLVNILYGAVSGVYFTAIKKLLAASSMGMTGWLGLLCSSGIWPLFLLLYSILVGVTLVVLSQLSIYNSHSITSSSGPESVLAMISLLSLAGAPPFSGFVLKWVVLTAIANSWGVLMWGLVPLLGISTFFYVSVGLLGMTSLSSFSKPQMKASLLSMALLLNLVGLLVMALV